MRPDKPYDGVYREYFTNSSGPRVNTDAVIAEALREQYPNLHLTITSQYECNPLAFAASGEAHAFLVDEQDTLPVTLKWKRYIPPVQRLDHSPGVLQDVVQFGKYIYKWKNEDYVYYSIVGAVDMHSQPMNYILGHSQKSTEALVLRISQFQHEIRNDVLVFDGGRWEKSADLWRQVQHSHWEDVILDPKMKRAIIGVVDTFFNSQDKYKKLKVPWKRGIIYYGPPGNGKTISIKAMMHSLSDCPDPIPTLYVRSLTSYSGPERSIQTIFTKARQTAPCFLVFEDLDSIISDAVRSYFLNEVDGLKSNDGIFMVGSTNHLDRLDPGIAKRPSRFDRKYLFPNPDLAERMRYCEHWRAKLADNPEIDFPPKLTRAIAANTHGFSFAYIQEAFVAALLVIAGEDSEAAERAYGMEGGSIGGEGLSGGGADDNSDDEDLNQHVLWRQMKIQIQHLRSELEAKSSKVKSLG